jgi:hypothetical protein
MCLLAGGGVPEGGYVRQLQIPSKPQVNVVSILVDLVR